MMRRSVTFHAAGQSEDLAEWPIWARRVQVELGHLWPREDLWKDKRVCAIRCKACGELLAEVLAYDSSAAEVTRLVITRPWFMSWEHPHAAGALDSLGDAPDEEVNPEAALEFRRAEVQAHELAFNRSRVNNGARHWQRIEDVPGEGSLGALVMLCRCRKVHVQRPRLDELAALPNVKI